MGPSFLPRLVNGPFDDPALYVPFRHLSRAFLFDVGQIDALSPREILKITHIFITHTHMDHFVGFDRILRLCLGRAKELHLVGPQGFLDNLSGKLAGYCWNLVQNYPDRFVLTATEVAPRHARTRRFTCREGFKPDGQTGEAAFDGTVLSEPALTVRAVHLDHGIPVLAFALEERFHINVIKTALDRMRLLPGPWLNRFKAMLYDGVDPQTPMTLPMAPDGRQAATYTVGELRSAAARITPGQRLVYIADAAGTAANRQKIVALADRADILFIEAAFSHRHREIARRKQHLTARQAGEIARLAKVKQFRLFHFSPRYTDSPEQLEQEAQTAFYDQSGVPG